MEAETPSGDVSVLVVMGVSGSGKSTIASMLAHRLHWIYEDGDWFHPKSNIEKMHHGEPLNDEDRWPWLHAIADWIDATRKAGNHGIVACSALKRAYRDILIGERRDVRLVYLKGDRDLIAPAHRRPRRSFHAAGIARQPVQGAGRTEGGRTADRRVRRAASARNRRDHRAESSVSTKLPSTRTPTAISDRPRRLPAGIGPMSDQPLVAPGHRAPDEADQSAICWCFLRWSMSSKAWARSSA